MKDKLTPNVSIKSILKNNLYLNELQVTDKLYDLLKKSQYNGYRTTTGIYIKLGATLPKTEFERNIIKKDENSISKMYEEYLKDREYTTAKIVRLSSQKMENNKSQTYFVLKENADGRLYIEGQYAHNDNIYPIKFDDVGIFIQENYNDEDAVAVQAGGIRIRVSICGENCISGCSFCDFGKGAKNYNNHFMNESRKKYIINSIEDKTIKSDINTLFITGGNPSLFDMNRWTDFLGDSIKKFKENVPNGMVDVMLVPRGFDKYIYDENRFEEYERYLRYLKLIGVNTISPNMELWNQKELEKFCPSNNEVKYVTKSEIGHDGYIDFIKAGIKLFGKYNVRTALIVGVNQVEDIKEAIKYLIPLGCYIVLSPFKSPNMEFYQYETNDSDLIELSNYLKKEIDKYLSSLPTGLANTYKKRISNSLNAHNTHNTANLCSEQNLDFLEEKVLKEGKDRNIRNNFIDMN